MLNFVIGTILNAAGILAGCLLALAGRGRLAEERQRLVKSVLGVLLVVAGLKTIWHGLHSPLSYALKTLGLMLLGLVLGRLVGRLLRLQHLSNRIGQYARQRMAEARLDAPSRLGDGLSTCALLFCLTPLSVLGSLQDGLQGRWLLLAIKGVMDGLAALAFTGMFGRGVVLSVIPVVAWQGLLTLGAHLLAQSPAMQGVVQDQLDVTSGFLAIAIALVVLEIKKVDLADYLPALALGPLLAWWIL